jgi:DNA-binding GntR family transcriptional regulator
VISTASPAKKTTPAVDRVYEHVKRAILERSYEGGTLVTEGEVAEAVGVSRTPVREALLRLEAEGLLRLYPKKGALVLPVSAKDIDDVLEARELVETYAAAKAWARRTVLIPELEALLDTMRHQLAAGEPRALMEADREFHAAVVGATGNPILTRLYAGLRDRQLCMGVAAMRISPERMDRAVDEHTAILDALRKGDQSRFRDLLRAHVVGAGEQLRTVR